MSRTYVLKLTLSSAIDWRFLSGFCWLTGPEVLGLPGKIIIMNEIEKGWSMLFYVGTEFDKVSFKWFYSAS